MATFNEIHEALIDLVYDHNPKRLNALSKKGVDVNIRDSEGRTPLHRAASGADMWEGLAKHGLSTAEKQKILEKLNKAGFDWNVQDKNGNTPLHLMRAANLEGADLKLIKAAGANLNIPNNAGETLAHVVSRTGYAHTQVLEYAKVGVDFKVIDKQGNTPFHACATKNGFASELDENVRAFREVGVDLRAKNNAGQHATDLYRQEAAAFERERMTNAARREKRKLTPADEQQIKTTADRWAKHLGDEVEAAQPHNPVPPKGSKSGPKSGPLKGQGGSATIGAMGALLAGGTALAAGESTKDAAKEAGVALVNVIPGVNVLTAPNADEAKVRADVTTVTAGTAALGTILGTPVAGAVTGLVGNLVSDEISRGYARHVEGKTGTVAPAAGETLVRGIASAAEQAVDVVKGTLTTAVNQLTTNTPSSSGMAHTKPPVKNEGVAKK